LEEIAGSRASLARDNLLWRPQRDPGGQEGILRLPLRDPNQAVPFLGEVRRLDSNAAGSASEYFAHLAHRFLKSLAVLRLGPVEDHEDETHSLILLPVVLDSKFPKGQVSQKISAIEEYDCGLPRLP